jgi:hypothetical protein
VDEVAGKALASLDEELGQAERLSPEVLRAMEAVRSRVKPHNWQAFLEWKVKDRPVAAVAQELGLTVQAVCTNVARICRMLQDETRRTPGPAE